VPHWAAHMWDSAHSQLLVSMGMARLQSTAGWSEVGQSTCGAALTVTCQPATSGAQTVYRDGSPLDMGWAERTWGSAHRRLPASHGVTTTMSSATPTEEGAGAQLHGYSHRGGSWSTNTRLYTIHGDNCRSVGRAVSAALLLCTNAYAY
jgi:hypothetical protein